MGRALEGKVAVVTGASKGGIGTAIAERFGAEGARVAVAARTRSGLEEALALVEAAGSTGGVYVVDLSRPDGGRDTLVAEVERDLGPVDILVNNSALGGYKPFDEWTMEQLQKVQEVNNWSAWMLAQRVLPGMRERVAGAILNISSASAELPLGPPFPHTAPARAGSAYGSTKAMLNRWTVSLAVETHGQGIQVNALSPQRAAATASLVGNAWFPDIYFEPLDTMAEAALALVAGDPAAITGRVTYSLALLAELERPVYDLRGEQLVDGWQPADLPAIVAAQDAEAARRDAEAEGTAKAG
ncbi:MAG TPA: SDR family NAD(P)-dependent oxidoreductase [Acidimicrobiia bacterium]|nr:SDR family NAD(P)-dependent oxidoreductase [Acidimicrobiia bacterium]